MVPDRRGRLFFGDLRFSVGAGPDGFFPLAIYARRAHSPLADTLDPETPSWDMLGTKLSVQTADGTWTTEAQRLRLMDNRDFNRLGIGVDDLIEGYVQSVLSVTAIDHMARRLVTQKKRFRGKRFAALDPDPALLSELMA